MQVVSGGGQPGPVIINVRGAKLMLGRGMAHRIMVRPD
jgi:Fe2+ transport system protein FeoA